MDEDGLVMLVFDVGLACEIATEQTQFSIKQYHSIYGACINNECKAQCYELN